MLRRVNLPSRYNICRVRSHKLHTSLYCSLLTNHCRGISVCISSGLSLEDTARACVESGAGILVVQHPAQLRTLLAAQHRLPQLRLLVLLHGEASGTDKRRLQRSCQKEILSWAALSAAGQVRGQLGTALGTLTNNVLLGPGALQHQAGGAGGQGGRQPVLRGLLRRRGGGGPHVLP